ncbi:prolyl-tRNA synthetase associated domain-containing protein [Pseudoalteromonas citrea]|uniref:Prolyl-tRNA synthetase associated domain-containing protein n=1 Tax=Pseudoalteromonas citrea TaxID=43655 RepID=A0A5S3XU17_9GAMM|nr:MULTISPECIES: prolyl-tRNA synthetase associated domain-containing protein [Pseudoalteromonas]RJE76247.1 Ala-tRNA(Pro) hydrolase [Pseudoalteromonas sp. MSK9-3]TMP45109.1 prolyl-tRNA synthetase associated domain-containing protein [Pseudoalteromonas citrea]TMP61509.1 prolyl-tRNA synthetase associated domain-containing protein [Pseudoalteromonas citrea]
MTPQQLKLKAVLETLRITFKSYEHPPLPTCTEAQKLGLKRSGVQIKNLFLRDNRGKKHILCLTRAHLKVDLKALSTQQKLSRLGLASTERLDKYLGVKPGCVSALALVNDDKRAVELWLDSGLLNELEWQCHPFENDKTWVLQQHDLYTFWRQTGHYPRIVDIPCL